MKMSAPSYADVGKSANDLFSKGYKVGHVSFEFKTKTPNDVYFNVNTNHSLGLQSKKITATVEAQHKFKECGINFTQKWSNENMLTSEISVDEGKLAKGMKATVEGNLSLSTAMKTVLVKTVYKTEAFHCNADIEMKSEMPVLRFASLYNRSGWMGGYQVSYDGGKKAIVKNNLIAGYQVPGYCIEIHANNRNEFGGSVYHKLRPNLEMAVLASWLKDSNVCKFAIAGKYGISKDQWLRAKVNNSSLLGVSYTQRMSTALSITLSALLNGKISEKGGHKMGMSLEFNV